MVVKDYIWKTNDMNFEQQKYRILTKTFFLFPAFKSFLVRIVRDNYNM